MKRARTVSGFLSIQRLGVLLILVVASFSPGALAQQSPPQGPDGEISDEIRAFCGNIADAARDQRYLLQAKELKELQSGIDERIRILEARRDEYREWLQKREDFLRVAEGKLVDIYKNMRADSAAAQLEILNPEVASAIIMKLSARLASQILNEMDAKKAASLTSIIASAAVKDPPKDPS